VKSVEFQLDNAGGHGKDQAVKLINEWAQSTKFEYKGQIEVSAVSQPANSPDTNIGDLGLFHGFKASLPDLESLVDPKERVIDRLREMAENHAYVDWNPAERIAKTIATLKAVCKAIVATKGDNTYNLRDYMP